MKTEYGYYGFFMFDISNKYKISIQNIRFLKLNIL